MTAWRMAFRAGKNGHEMWPDCYRLGVAAIEYTPVADVDLSQYPRGEPRSAWAQLAGTSPHSLQRFVYEMNEGDVIYVKQGARIVGKGVISGPYQFDKSNQIREPNGAYWQHQRSVNWTQDFSAILFQLGTQQIATVKQLTDQEVASFEQTVSHSYLHADKGDEAELNHELSFAPQDVDRRQMIWQLICKRRGQQPFRDALRARYNDRCVVTGCEILDVLEAAHINPYRGEDDNHPQNGLLLRADIHTLFDLDLLGIEPDQLLVELHPRIAEEYGHLAGKKLGCWDNRRPSEEALRRRYELFQERLNRSV